MENGLTRLEGLINNVDSLEVDTMELNEVIETLDIIQELVSDNARYKGRMTLNFSPEVRTLRDRIEKIYFSLSKGHEDEERCLNAFPWYERMPLQIRRKWYLHQNREA